MLADGLLYLKILTGKKPLPKTLKIKIKWKEIGILSQAKEQLTIVPYNNYCNLKVNILVRSSS